MELRAIGENGKVQFKQTLENRLKKRLLQVDGHLFDNGKNA